MWIVTPISNGFIVCPYNNNGSVSSQSNQRYVEKVEDVGSAIIALEAKEKINPSPTDARKHVHLDKSTRVYVDNNPTVQSFTNNSYEGKS